MFFLPDYLKTTGSYNQFFFYMIRCIMDDYRIIDACRFIFLHVIYCNVMLEHFGDPREIVF